MFELNPQLHRDSVYIGRFELSMVLLQQDCQYPWCILVPRRSGVEELFHLAEEDQIQLIKESSHLAEVMHDIFSPDKMNIAALGNVVSQLHVHHVARFKTDPAWPGPCWGAVPAKPYAAAEREERIEKLRHALEGEGFSV